MKTFIASITLFFIFIFQACNSYTNKEKYELKIGETVEIYYSTNSCCYYCLLDETKYKHLKFIERKTVKESPKDCDGCNYTAAFVFKAESVGTDTVTLKHLGATMNCDSNDVTPEKYIIEVNAE